MRSLRAALSYFSILPGGVAAPVDSAAIAWLPFVGATVGGIAGSLALAVSHTAPPALAVAAAFGAGVVLTGAIHLDGFLDGCDAFFASVTAQRRREILKDPRHGTFAVAGAAVLVVVWVAALSSLSAARLPAALALAGASARWGAVVHAVRLPFVRGIPEFAARADRPPLAVLALGFALTVILAVPLGIAGAIAAAVAIASAAICMLWAESRLGGVRAGDVYGFAITVAEVAALVSLAATEGYRA
ncbi:MAG: cobV [Candidatus Eremiobacteraeota bacterium]|nr:cobV [Candidatus Eremiobacteraeota bacterium]